MFDSTTHRRGFLGKLAAAAALGLTGLTPLRLEAQPETPRTTGADPSFEAWLNRITGRHKIVFDAPEPNNGMPVVWPRVWLNTMRDNYGTPDAQNIAVVIARHSGLPIALKDEMWAKYKLGEVFKINDGAAPATRNVYGKQMPLPLPGTGIEQLLAAGVMFGACAVAIALYGGMVAQNMGLDAATVRADWIANLYPGVQVVPSGVLAVSRAQEKGCAYCFAG